MGKKSEKFVQLMQELELLLRRAKGMEKVHEEALSKVDAQYELSAKNLVHYRGLRMSDMRELQKQLGYLGMSRLAKAESHVLASVEASRNMLQGFLLDKRLRVPKMELSIKKGTKLLRQHTRALLGYPSRGRRTRIMVTMPSHAADDPKLIQDMIRAGMNCARINCAHDNAEVWGQIIAHIRDANKRLGKNCKIAMDLAGPKIRTGKMAPGPEILKLNPDRAVTGHIIQPVKVWLSEEPHPDLPEPHLPLTYEAVQGLRIGDKLYMMDNRGKLRNLKVVESEENGKWANCYDTLYVQSGTPVYRDKEFQVELGLVGTIEPREQKIVLHTGDTLRIDKEPIPGEPAVFSQEGELLKEAHVACTAPEVFEFIEVGDPVLFDDGKIEGEIALIESDYFRVNITRSKVGGGKLKADKGINFPQSNLDIRGLTAKDKEDFLFVAKHADVVNMSFVNTEEDVRELVQIMDRLDVRDKLGVILKIETQQGFNRLTDILLEAMQVFPVGIMIARGDLAIETGWEEVGRIQEEMLSICQSAHVPVIWATQVLETLAKKGIPSRAEITDAVMAQRAECVMLNKGPQIIQTIALLDSILKGMAPYQEKNAPMLPALETAGE